jgi:hypothetical protein
MNVAVKPPEYLVRLRHTCLQGQKVGGDEAQDFV